MLPVLKRLLEKQVIVVDEELYETYKPKQIRYIKIHDNYLSDDALNNLIDSLSRAPKQREIVLSYFSMSSVNKSPIKVLDLIKKSNASSAQIKALIDKEIFQDYHLNVDRVSFKNDEMIPSMELNLNQSKTLDEISKSFENKEITRPEHWGGYIVKPISIEFWQGRPNRMHDRIKYTLQEDYDWKIERLAP